MGIIRRQGIKNTITGYTGILIGFVNLFVIQPHCLTKEELGLTRLLYSFSILIAMIVPLGIGNATLRFFPLFKNREKNHHGYFAFMNLFPLCGYVLVFILLFLFRPFILNQFRTQSPLFLDYFNFVLPLIFFNGFIAVLSSYCNSNFKSTIPSFLNDIVVRILTIGMVGLYFIRVVNLNQFIALFVTVYAIQLLLLMIYIYKFDRPVFKIDWNVFREKHFFSLIRYSTLFWFASFASLGIKYFDSIMVGKFMPLAFVAIYSIAAYIPTIIEAPLVAFEKIAAAKISFAWAEGDKGQIYNIYHKSSLYLFLIGGFIFLNIAVNIHAVLTFLPSGYQEGETVVLIIGAGTLFNMATGLNAPILSTSEKYRYHAVFLIILLLIDLVLQMIFIRSLGINGAAMATSISSFIYNTLLFISVYKFFGLQPFNKKNLFLLFTVILIFLLIPFLPHFNNIYADIIIRTGMITAGYGLLVYAGKIIPEVKNYLPWNKKIS